jgi:aminomethyltransferase
VSGDLLHHTVLTEVHRRLGARMVGFAGYEMPVQYADGVLKEHLWTRSRAGLFDVSHMGPAFLTLAAITGDPEADHAAISAVLEPLICGDLASLVPGQLRYTLLLNDDAGVIDDLIVGRPVAESEQGTLYLVVNAGNKAKDFALIAARAAGAARLERADDQALIAIQGPKAAEALAEILPEVPGLGFMRHRRIDVGDDRFLVSRSGYTGEDGFEILVAAHAARTLWDRLLEDSHVRPVGLGARDSLRLEAGLPLHGQDIDESTSPIEAALDFAVSRRRLRNGDIPGAARIARERKAGPARLRVGLRVLDGAPARQRAPILGSAGEEAGVVTSGGFSPSLGAPIAMGYVTPDLAKPETPLTVMVRGRPQPAEVVAMPFVPHNYHRPAA